MNRPKLIVLSGEAGAGKDSVADALEGRGWQRYSLAGPLKRFAADMFGFTAEQLYGPSSARNAPDPRWARPCEDCGGVNEDCLPEVWRGACKPCGGTGLINDNSPRRVLQLLGEEYLRQMIHVDALTMRARPDLEEMLARGESIVVNDARNDNDRNNLHAWLGACRVDVRSIRTKEPHKVAEAWRQHKSERRLATDDQLEFIVQNDEDWPFPSLSDKVDEMLKELFE